MTKSVYDSFEVDQSLLASGVVLDVVTPEGDRIGTIRCLPADGDLNPRYRAAAARALEEIQRAGVVEDTAMTARIYAESVFIDWSGPGWRDRDGNPLPYSTDNCARVMAELPTLFRQLQREARRWTNWRRAYPEGIAGK